jgi:hypothetical protein
LYTDDAIKTYLLAAAWHIDAEAAAKLRAKNFLVLIGLRCSGILHISSVSDNPN